MAAKKTAKKQTESTPEKVKSATKAAKKAPAIIAVAANKSPAVAKPKKSGTVVKPSLDTIARAAYLNYRRRVESGLPGDSHSDWLEAEQQFSQLKR